MALSRPRAGFDSRDGRSAGVENFLNIIFAQLIMVRAFRFLNEEEIIKVTRESLREKFPLYQEGDVVRLYGREVFYGSNEARPYRDDANHFYFRSLGNRELELLELGVRKDMRGTDNHFALFDTVNDVAWRFGFKTVKVFFTGIAGFVPEGKDEWVTTRAYLLGKGYVESDENCVKLDLELNAR